MMNSNYSKWALWLAARVREPSTWSGAGVVAIVAHQFLPGAVADAALAIGAAVGGLIAVLIPESAS